MACYSPLRALEIGLTPEGKKKLLFLDQVDLAYKHFNDEDILLIPCGQCRGCRLEYSRQWANRCMLELQDHDSAYFVTLTYNDEHVPVSYYPDPYTGEAFPSLTLDKPDVQKFFKRVRKRFPADRIRYYGCGEYGPLTMRPHYHMIIFGLHLDDLRVSQKSELGYQYYESLRLNGAWTDDDGNLKGYVSLGQVTWESCAYVARYIMKKQKGKLAQFYQDFNIVPEFSMMSLKPGIGRKYYDDHPDLYKYEYINLATDKGGLKFRPPRYFDRLYDIDMPEHMAAIKAARRTAAVERMKSLKDQSDLSVDEILAVQDHSLSEKIQKLRRNKV